MILLRMKVMSDNTPIRELMQKYTKECCDFTDMAYVIKCTKRYVLTMPDSQHRCFLQAFIDYNQDEFITQSKPPKGKD